MIRNPLLRGICWGLIYVTPLWLIVALVVFR